jgi:hypothetical protein
MQAKLVLVLLLSVPASLGATMYKCQDGSGKTTYTDQPCKAGEVTAQKSEAAPRAAAQPAGTPSAAAASGPEKALPPYKRPQPVVVPPLPDVDLSGLAKDSQGRPVLAQSGGTALVLEKQVKLRPVNVLAACSSLVTRCYKPGERELDACFMSVPRCTSAQPWDDPAYKPCCPAQCWNEYEAKRIAGVSPQAALHATLFGGEPRGGGCIPVR